MNKHILELYFSIFNTSHFFLEFSLSHFALSFLSSLCLTSIFSFSFWLASIFPLMKHCKSVLKDPSEGHIKFSS